MYMTVLKMTRESILSAPMLLDINSSNSVHKWLTEQQNTSRAEGQILYKIINANDEVYMYIQSKDPFNKFGLDNYGFKFIKEMEITLSTPGVYSFDIQTFPCRTVNNNKRYFIKNIRERYDWLQGQFKKYNIELLECTEYKQSNIVFDKDKIKDIPTSTFRGKIKISDVDSANKLLEHGLGRFRNYGLGLLLIK